MWNCRNEKMWNCIELRKWGIAKVKLMRKPMWLNNAKKGIKKRRRRGILVKLKLVVLWLQWVMCPVLGLPVVYMDITRSTQSYAAGTWSTAGTLATSGLHSWYSVYDGELLAGTKPTSGTTEGYRGRNYLVLSLQQEHRWYIGYWICVTLLSDWDWLMTSLMMPSVPDGHVMDALRDPNLEKPSGFL